MGAGAGRGASLPHRAGRVVLAFACVVLLGACRADLVVHVDVHAGGGGEVRAVITLDKAAAGQAPDLARQLRLEDLEAAGWEVRGPTPAGEGGVELALSKGFSSPAQAHGVLEELSGEDGPFSSLRVVRTQSLWRVATRLEGRIDLAKGLDAFGDPRLTEQLGGPNLGLDPAAVERELGRPLAEAVTVTLVADLPGAEDTNAPERERGRPAWPVALGSAATVSAATEHLNTARIVATGLVLVSGTALLVVTRQRRRRRR